MCLVNQNGIVFVEFSDLCLEQGTPVNIIVGSHVWVEDPEEAWLDGQVTEIKGKKANIITTNEKTVSFFFGFLPRTWEPQKHNKNFNFLG